MHGSISLSLSHMTVLTTCGEVYISGTSEGKPVPIARNPAVTWQPVSVTDAFSSLTKNVRAVTTRGGVVAMLTDDGDLLCSNHPDHLFKYSFTSAKIVQVALGINFGLVLLDSGHVFSYGSGRSCALGHGDRDDRRTPVFVAALTGFHIVCIAAGTASAAVTLGGNCFTWGKGHYGQLGHGGTQRQMLPKRIASEFIGDARVERLSCSHAYMMAVCDQGTVLYAWGANHHGCMGVGEIDHGYLRPTRVDMHAFRGCALRRVSCACMHAIALTRCGCLYATGMGRHGALGTGGTHSCTRFQRVALDAVAVDVDTSKYTSAALTEDGRLFTWGAAVLPSEEFGTRRSQRLQDKHPHTTGISPDKAPRLVPTLFHSAHWDARGVESLGRDAFLFLTMEKKLAFAMGLQGRCAARSWVSVLSEDLVRKIFSVYTL